MNKIVFAGTSDFAVPSLKALHAAGMQIVAVLTQPDRPAGRGRKLKASPVKEAAEALGLDVWQPSRLDEDFYQQYIQHQLDFLVVAAYGLIVPERVLEHPRYGGINVHGSLLPRWRGAAPVARAILAGDNVTGVCIMQMDKGLDTGPVWARVETEIGLMETAANLEVRLAALGSEALVETLSRWPREDQPDIQDSTLSTYAHKLEKSEGQIDWQQDSLIIIRQIRALAGRPGVFFERIGVRHKIGEATLVGRSDLSPGQMVAASDQVVVGCGKGTAIGLKTLQRPGGKMLPWAQFRQGLPEGFLS